MLDRLKSAFTGGGAAAAAADGAADVVDAVT